MIAKILGVIKGVPPIYAIGLGLFVALAGYIANLRHGIAVREAELLQMEYSKDSLIAVNSENRRFTDNLLEGLHGVVQLAAQTELRADSLDQALQQRSAVRSNVVATADTGRVEGTTGVSITEEGNYFAEYHEYAEPYTVDLELLVRPSEQLVDVEAIVSLDPAPMSFRIACVESEGRINSAQMNVISPEWLDVQIVDVFQNRTVCNPPPPEIIKPPFYKRPLFVVPTTAAAVLGLLKVFGVF